MDTIKLFKEVSEDEFFDFVSGYIVFGTEPDSDTLAFKSYQNKYVGAITGYVTGNRKYLIDPDTQATKRFI